MSQMNRNQIILRLMNSYKFLNPFLPYSTFQINQSTDSSNSLSNPTSSPAKMDKIRKRSFTNYQESSELTQSLLNQVIEQQINQNIHKSTKLHESDHKHMNLGLLKSKKAKVLRKFDKFDQKTARQSTQNGNISTIQSLKRQVLALQNQDILSYRLKTTKDHHKNSDQLKDNSNQSEISLILKRFNSIKQQLTNDKFRRKFLLFGNTNILPQPKTQRSSLKSKSIEAQIDIQCHTISKRKLNKTNLLTNTTQKLTINNYQRASSMSLTARKFYGRHDKKRNMTENDETIFSGMSSVKKHIMAQKTLSGSSGAF